MLALTVATSMQFAVTRPVRFSAAVWLDTKKTVSKSAPRRAVSYECLPGEHLCHRKSSALTLTISTVANACRDLKVRIINL